MKVLCACEESQRVCIAFREKGHEAYSCDIIECSGGHPEWHIQCDVLGILNGNCGFMTRDGQIHSIVGNWDLIIAFSPCTHLAVSGARYFEDKRNNGKQEEAIEFFCKFLEAKAEKVVIENPIGIISGIYILEHFPELAHAYCLPQTMILKLCNKTIPQAEKSTWGISINKARHSKPDSESDIS